MTYTIFLHANRVPFLQDEMPYGKVKVVETDPHGLTTVEITIEDSFDLLKAFHAGILAGEKLSKQNLV